jgi:stearoyl-CoA desaturase (delta-9 desaturase)
VWAGLVRVFLLHHATWSVNSICHMYGKRPFETEDESRNNWAVALVSLGEGWHHSHHAFPTSAKHGLSPGQLDPSYRLIKLFERFGWASNVKHPKPEQIDAKRRGAAAPERETAPLAA